MSVTIAKVCGLCGGCQRAIRETLAAAEHGRTVLYREIVHNPHVNQTLMARGVKIVDTLEEIPDSSTVILRAHGEPPATYQTLTARGIAYRDCTCPHVQRIHQIVAAVPAAALVLVIGKATHPEVLGTLGYAAGDVVTLSAVGDVEKLAARTQTAWVVVGQTTFSAALFQKIVAAVQDLAKRLKRRVTVHNTLCQAQQTIQQSAVELAKNCDLMVVVGGRNSHNTRELYEILRSLKPTIFIEAIDTWREALAEIGFKLTSATRVGLTAGASTDRAELEALRARILAAQVK